MAGYTVFLGPIAGSYHPSVAAYKLNTLIGIMIADYYVVKKGGIDVPALYKPKGRYKYYGGFVSTKTP